MSQNPPIKVALLMGQDLGYSRGVTSGIIRYVEKEKPNWIIMDAPVDIQVLPGMIEWGAKGVIVHLFDRGLADLLKTLNIPMVSTTDTLEGLNLCRIDVDNDAVGVLAAEYFLRKGYRNFGYYGSQVARFSVIRRNAFIRTIESAGYSVKSFDANFLPRPPFGKGWNYLDDELRGWLVKLPKPAAVFCSNDVPARLLCEFCHILRIKVPSEIAILGVDNDTSECRMASTPISSIAIPTQEIGYRSAEMLTEIMAGGEEFGIKETLPPIGLIERASTEPSSDLSRSVKAALQYIDESANCGINVDMVAAHCGLSRRSLERAFREELDVTVLDEIRRAQVEHAKRLLRESKLRVSEVAEHVGLESSRNLNRAFAKYCTESPRSYRNRHL